jgi:ribosomal protein S27AE
MTKIKDLPELPLRGRKFICTKCGSELCTAGHEHKKYPPCVKCGYLGFAFDVSWTDEQVQDYARKAQAMVAECRMLTEDEISSCEVFTCEV